VPSPTYWQSHANRHPDDLNFFITTLPSHIKYTITNSSDLSYDNTPILLTLNDTSTATKNYPKVTLGKTNWKKFSQTIQNAITLKIPLKNLSDLDTAVHSFSNIIQDAALGTFGLHPKTTLLPLTQPMTSLTHNTTHYRKALCPMAQNTLAKR